MLDVIMSSICTLHSYVLFKQSGLMKAHEKPQETFRSQKFCQGPKLGGNMAWAYNAGHVCDNPAMPPAANWKAQNVGWELLDSAVRQSTSSQRNRELQQF